MPTFSAPAVSTAKRTAKRLLDRHPRLLKNNALYYELQRRRAYRDFRVRPQLTARPELLEQLIHRGVAVVPRYLQRKDVDVLLSSVERTVQRAMAGDFPDHVFTVQPDILCRIAPADRLVPETHGFFSDPVICSVFQAYMSPNVRSYRREIDYRFGVSRVAQADLYHFDNWRPLCKAFLYLVDVAQENAPFVYVPGTHRQGSWRRRHDLAYEVEGTNGRFGHFFPQEMRDLRARFGWEDLVCIGEAGTLILADLRGLHRGTPLLAGRRIMLTNAFDLMSPRLDRAHRETSLSVA